MRLPPKTLILSLATVMALTSCASVRESRLNPFNWFGRSKAAPVEEFGVAVVEDARPLVEQVQTMVIEPTQQGAIVRATGLSPMQGYYDAELVPRPVDDKGVLVFDFRIKPPPVQKPVGTPRTREVTVAAALSNIALQEITQIVVQGASNARSSRR